MLRQTGKATGKVCKSIRCLCLFLLHYVAPLAADFPPLYVTPSAAFGMFVFQSTGFLQAEGTLFQNLTLPIPSDRPVWMWAGTPLPVVGLGPSEPSVFNF